jgi:hypothetical protein
MGATEVDVGGTNYDVSFQRGTCYSLLNECTAFAFTTAADTELASSALRDQVFVFGSNFDIFPLLTNGAEGTGPVEILTPYELNSAVFLISTTIFINYGGFPSPDTVFTNFRFARDSALYAIWTPTAVPLPAAAWLFISAIGGLVVAKRRQLKA